MSTAPVAIIITLTILTIPTVTNSQLNDPKQMPWEKCSAKGGADFCMGGLLGVTSVGGLGNCINAKNCDNWIYAITSKDRDKTGHHIYWYLYTSQQPAAHRVHFWINKEKRVKSPPQSTEFVKGDAIVAIGDTTTSASLDSHFTIELLKEGVTNQIVSRDSDDSKTGFNYGRSGSFANTIRQTTTNWRYFEFTSTNVLKHSKSDKAFDLFADQLYPNIVAFNDDAKVISGDYFLDQPIKIFAKPNTPPKATPPPTTGPPKKTPPTMDTADPDEENEDPDAVEDKGEQSDTKGVFTVLIIAIVAIVAIVIIGVVYAKRKPKRVVRKR